MTDRFQCTATVAEHQFRSSLRQTSGQHEEGIFFCVHTLFEEGLLTLQPF